MLMLSVHLILGFSSLKSILSTEKEIKELIAIILLITEYDIAVLLWGKQTRMEVINTIKLINLGRYLQYRT